MRYSANDAINGFMKKHDADFERLTKELVEARKNGNLLLEYATKSKLDALHKQLDEVLP